MPTRFRTGLYDESFEVDSCGVGLVVNARRGPTHLLIEQALEILRNLAHRSALGADGKTSDGAGLLCQIPDAFFRRELGDILPPVGEYAVGMIFAGEQHLAELHAQAKIMGMRMLATRAVPVNSNVLGPQARALEPRVTQIFLAAQKDRGEVNFRLALVELRRWAENRFRRFSGCRDPETGETLSQFYFCSLSIEKIVFKGLMRPKDLAAYFTDLADPMFASQYALVHSRFSTNTMPAWELAQPFRLSCHNGEINTIRANRQWMQARGLPLTEGRSDSNSFDEALEHLILGGQGVVESMMMMIPEPWEDNPQLDREFKEFYAHKAQRMEPWDGPAALCFADRGVVGVCLDRNGLRPCRYQVLRDGTLVAGSEAGALDVPASEVEIKGQLSPGKLLVVDLRAGHIDLQNEYKTRIALAKPYRQLNEAERVDWTTNVRALPRKLERDFWVRAQRFGFHYDEVLALLLPMLRDKEEPISSMGYDTPLPLLSDRPQLLSQYFRQQFAQVTNPPIDPIREKSVMSLTTYLGVRAKRYVRLASPILFSAEVAALPIPAHVLSTVFSEDLQSALDDLENRARLAVREGAELLLLSDKGGMPIPALLAVSCVHQMLVREGLRLRTSLLVQTGEARDPHQLACLISFGADAVHPYLIEELAQGLKLDGEWLPLLSLEQTLEHYRIANNKSLLKIMSKLGISTLQSYCGAQAFEVLGLGQALCDKYFPAVPTRTGGLDLELLAEETRRRWNDVNEDARSLSDVPSLGDLHYRADGENHQWNPRTLAALQRATRDGDFTTFKEFSAEIHKGDRFGLRGHLHFRTRAAVPLEEVEAAADIVKRFTTGAMSLGALGSEAHETLAIAMNALGAKSNSGEGGEDAARFLPDGELNRNSAIKQIASGRFGVTAHYLVNARELQIKMAQGAKPGEGGQLMGHKVDAEIARIRHSTPGVTLISPPPHHDIYSIEDLAQLIFDLQSVNPNARISVKLVAKAGVGTIAAGVAKAQAAKILISGDGGGTGASPLTSIRHAGVPWELGLSETHQTLRLNGLRGQVTLEADGQLRTGRDVAIAALLGADEYGFSTAPLVVEGCLMMRKCHLNTCPVGVATQDPELRAKFKGQPEHLINYFFFVAEELRQIMSTLGVRRVADLVGRTDLLEWRAPLDHWKARSLDLSALLETVAESTLVPKPEQRRLSFDQRENMDLPHDRPLGVKNTDRAVGTWLAGEVARAQGAKGLPAQTIRVPLRGSVGQSLGAFLMKGIELRLQGEANDYVGKGLSGGRIVITHDPEFSGVDGKSSLIGNTCLYGATSGELFAAGLAGERFAVRNSGATAVVEGVGDHACEYMTGGHVVVLGPTGKNFAAGMSGGLAYVYDEHGLFRGRCNREMVDVEPLSAAADQDWLRLTLADFAQSTGSARARSILNAWPTARFKILKVTPRDYRRFLERKPEPAKEMHV